MLGTVNARTLSAFLFTAAPIINIIMLIGAFISIFPNQLKAPQGWKLWIMLPVGAAASCANHYPSLTILHLLYWSTFYPPVSKSARWVFSSFRNPPNFHVDYRESWTCSIRDHSYACATHGGWAHRQWVITTFFFLLEKTDNCQSTPLAVSMSLRPRTWNSSSKVASQARKKSMYDLILVVRAFLA